MFRWAVAALLLSGCTGLALPYDHAPDDLAAAPDPAIEALLVRVFVDDVDGDRRADIVVRLGGLHDGREVLPFDGTVMVWLHPGEGGRDWLPRFWWAQVDESEFVAAELPYREFVGDGRFLRPGEPIRVEAVAELPDGTLVEGRHNTFV